MNRTCYANILWRMLCITLNKLFWNYGSCHMAQTRHKAEDNVLSELNQKDEIQSPALDVHRYLFTWISENGNSENKWSVKRASNNISPRAVSRTHTDSHKVANARLLLSLARRTGVGRRYKYANSRFNATSINDKPNLTHNKQIYNRREH